MLLLGLHLQLEVENNSPSAYGQTRQLFACATVWPGIMGSRVPAMDLKYRPSHWAVLDHSVLISRDETGGNPAVQAAMSSVVSNVLTSFHGLSLTEAQKTPTTFNKNVEVVDAKFQSACRYNAEILYAERRIYTMVLAVIAGHKVRETYLGWALGILSGLCQTTVRYKALCI